MVCSENSKSPLAKCVRHTESDIGGAGRGQRQAGCTCHNNSDWIFEVVRTSSEWVIPRSLPWVMG